MALELVVAPIISSSLQFLFEKLVSGDVLAYLRGKSNKGCDFEELVGKLNIKLSSVLAVMEDAEKKRTKSMSVRVWLDDLQEWVFDAEDLLDDIEFDVMMQKQKSESSTDTSKKLNAFKKKLRNVFKKKLRNVFKKKLRNVFKNDGDMETKVKKLLGRFEDIATRMNGLSLVVCSIQEKASCRSPSTSLVDESSVYGRDSDKGAVIKLLMSDDGSIEKIHVISIVGMGGLGKTTLAQSVYNDRKVKENFELTAWVCVSEEFDVYKVTKAIYKEVIRQDCDAMEMNLLQVKLKEHFTRKKFLIVFDDVWCERSFDLDFLCLPFKEGDKGSKVIVTTRSENVASAMGATHSHRLQLLSEEESWQMFKKEVSCVGGDFTGNKDLERIGREIVKKCKGLPLALKTLGGLLRSKLDVGEWERIQVSDIWDLREDESNILPALKLSYQFLPSQLKRCFAYCSMFPTDYEFKKEKLILLWMAENFLENPKGNRRIEDVGDDYFNYLVSRSFFQRLSIGSSKFVMHDLIHDLAKSVSGEYCLHLEGEINVKKTRHLTYNFRTNPHLLNKVVQATNLRTFRILKRSATMAAGVVNDLVVNLSCLRALSLSGYEEVELPELIGDLRHLRYLDLSHSDNLSLLPDSLCKLLQLQTLKLKSCCDLRSLPKDMHHLINLRHLDLRDCDEIVEMPTQISKLKNLQMLSTFIVGKDNSGAEIGELMKLSNIRGMISIEKLENVGNVSGALDKKHLEELNLKWSDDSNCDSDHAKDVLDMLSPNNRSLKKLYIDGYPGKEFSSWLGRNSLSNMVCLTLAGCRNCLSLPALGQLPSLKELNISNLKALVQVGPEFYGDGYASKPFPSLEILRFKNMQLWETWVQNDSTDFGKLSELEIERCNNLYGDFGKLSELTIERCNNLYGDLPSFLPSLTKLKIDDGNNWDLLGFLPSFTKLKIDGFQQFAFKLPRMPRVIELSVNGWKSHSVIELSSTLKKFVLKKCEEVEIQFECSYKSVEEVKLVKSCDALKSFPFASFPKLKDLTVDRLENLASLCLDSPAQNLTKLVIKECKKMKSLPEKMNSFFPCLEYLEVNDCPDIESFPEEGLPFSLTFLNIDSCDKLISSRSSWGLKRLPNLISFVIYGRRNEEVESFPEEGLFPATITYLWVASFQCLKSIDKNGLRQLTSLERLVIYGLPKLQAIPGEVLSNSLKELIVRECNELQTISEEGLPTSLDYLQISNCPKCHIMPKKGLPTSLKSLWIRGFPELQSIPVLPNSLQDLSIDYCPKLKTITKNDFPNSLQRLTSHGCPLMSEKCKRGGEYWEIIANIPHKRVV